MNDKNETVILVNPSDDEIGTAPKLAAHRDGRLHRAFSVFVTDDKERILLQRRADGKYHSGGLWTNACCGHPRHGESTISAAARRLHEELGIECELTELASFIYRAELDNGLIEHELDHVFTGHFTGTPRPTPGEVQEIQWIFADDLRSWLEREPEVFTAWFAEAFEITGLGTIRSSTFADDSTPGTPPPG